MTSFLHNTRARLVFFAFLKDPAGAGAAKKSVSGFLLRPTKNLAPVPEPLNWRRRLRTMN